MDVFSGSCLCGQVRFEAMGTPDRVGICHCFTCRKFTGSPFAMFAIYPREAVKVSGNVSEHATSAEGRRYRCKDCGAPVYESDRNNSEIEIPIGAFDRTDLFKPTYEIWTTRRESWMPRIKSVSASHPQDRPTDMS